MASPLENPNSIDVVALDADGETYIVALTETRPWTGSDDQIAQLQGKLNTYLSFILDGQMAALYPESADKPKRIQVHGTTALDQRTADTLLQARAALEQYGIDLSVLTQGQAVDA